MKRIIIYLLALLPLQMLAADYVDAINSAATKNETGHQVIYEMNIGSFTAEGTLAAAQQQLDELKTLGIDIVWLMPIYPRGGGINSPYAATDFQQVNPAYGTVSDLKAFVAAAHELHMQVWLDWVPNHTATNATWVTTHPEYYKKNGNSFVHPNNYSDVYQLNYGSADLQKAMNDCLKLWIDEADIAQDVTRLKSVGFDYDYAWGYQGSLASYGSSGVYAAPLKTNADKLLTASGSVSFSRMLYLTNHDQNWNESKKTLIEKYGANRYPLTVLAYTLYGMPLIYNGQETGGNQALNYFEDTKINWSTKDAKMLNTLRTLTALKHAAPALGDRVAVNWVTLSPANANVLAFTRKVSLPSGETGEGAEILVVLNMGNTATTATLTGLSAGAWSLWLNSETVRQGTSRRQQYLSASQNIALDAKGYRVYVRGTYPEEALPAPEVYTPTLETADEVSLFFETATEHDYAVWAWGTLGGGEAYHVNTSWPGDEMTLMGQTATGRYVYKYTFTKVTEAAANLIISYNGGNTKIYDGVAFVNHGYYVEGNDTPTQIISSTGIREIVNSKSANGSFYDLSGRKVSRPQARRGLYIRNGKKYIVR